MRSSWLVILVAALCGCRDPEIAALEQIKDEVCACKTTICGEEAIKRVPQEPADVSLRAKKLAQEMITCLSKLREAEHPPSDPEAEPAPAVPTSP